MLICIDVSHTKTDNRLVNNILFKNVMKFFLKKS